MNLARLQLHDKTAMAPWSPKRAGPPLTEELREEAETAAKVRAVVGACPSASDKSCSCSTDVTP